MGAKLLAEKGLLKGLILSLEEGQEWFVGRDPDECSLIIDDPKVSRKHVRCHKSDAGLILENLSDTNPLIVNQQVISGPYLLTEGDRVKLGDSSFLFTNAQAPKLQKDQEEESAHDPSNTLSFSTSDEPWDAYYETIFVDKTLSFGTAVYKSPEERKEAAQEALQRKEEELPPPTVDANTRWILKVMTGPNPGIEFPLDNDNSYIIGTDQETCDIVLKDISISHEHARLNLDPYDNLTIEDLGSRNGIIVDGKPVEGIVTVEANHLIALGTSTIMIIDTEKKTETLVTVEEPPKDHLLIAAIKKLISSVELPQISAKQLALTTVIGSIVTMIALGLFSLFTTEEIALEELDIHNEIRVTLADHPDLEFNYSAGTLFVVGHVTTKTEHEQLIHYLKSQEYVERLNDSIIIDELVWQETNNILSKNPAWRSINMHSPRPGYFVLTGYLQTNQEAEALTDYINLHFPYLDRLSSEVIVEEQILEKINVSLLENSFHDIFVELSNGELTISGYMSSTKSPILRQILTSMEVTPGVRSIKNFVVELAPEESMINLSERYAITGNFRKANVNVSIVINGRILARGDKLDGMTITSITPSSVFLEKDGYKFRIDY